MPVTDLNVFDVFSYHSPSGDQPARYEAVREAARSFAIVVLANVPACADQQAAIRHIREAVMTANAGIALDGKV